MATSSLVIANKFIDLARKDGRKLTNMQVQKLVFIANGFALAYFERPLHYHNAHAWQWGPVIPVLYKKLQKYGNSFVTDPIPLSDNEMDLPNSSEMDLIQAIYGVYGKKTGSELSRLTHLPGTPWSKQWAEKPFGVITTDIIQDHYIELLEIA